MRFPGDAIAGEGAGAQPRSRPCLRRGSGRGPRRGEWKKECGVMASGGGVRVAHRGWIRLWSE